MDQNGAAVGPAMRLPGLGQGGKHPVRCRFSVRMDKDLHIICKGPFHHLEGLLGGHGRIADITRREIADRRVVGPVPPGGEALGRSVDCQLDATNPEPPVIGAAGVVLDIGAVGREIGVGDDINLDLAFRRHRLQHGIDGLARPALLRGCVTERGPHLGPGLRQHLYARRADIAQNPGKGVEPGRFLDHAAWFLAARLAVDDAAGRVRRIRRVSRQGQSLGVKRAHVGGLMNDHHRHIRRDGIKLFLGRRAQFRQLRLVIAEAQDDLGRLHDLRIGIGPFLQRCQKARDIRHLAVRRGQQIGTDRLHAAPGHVAVRVNKAGQQGAPFQVDHAGGVRLQRHDFCKRSYSKDTAIFDGNGIGARSGIGHRQDRTAGINRIRRFGTLRRCGSGHQNGGTRHQECSAGQAHCKGLLKDTAGLGPAGEAIVTVGPGLYPESGPGQSV